MSTDSSKLASTLLDGSNKAMIWRNFGEYGTFYNTHSAVFLQSFRPLSLGFGKMVIWNPNHSSWSQSSCQSISTKSEPVPGMSLVMSS